jgi:hypothetical protein
MISYPPGVRLWGGGNWATATKSPGRRLPGDRGSKLAAERAGEDGLLHAVDGGQRFLRRLPGALLTREQAV